MLKDTIIEEVRLIRKKIEKEHKNWEKIEKYFCKLQKRHEKKMLQKYYSHPLLSQSYTAIESSIVSYSTRGAISLQPTFFRTKSMLQVNLISIFQEVFYVLRPN